MNLFPKNFKVAVAGSSRGLGKCIAEAFHTEGTEVWTSGRSASLSNANSLESKNYSSCDLETSDGRKKFFTEISSAWGSLDALVLNIGGGKSTQQGLSAQHEEWQRVWNLNFFSHVHLIELFAPLLEKSSNASIVSISSVVAQTFTLAPSSYATAKAALDQFCLYTSRDLAEKNIRYNVVAPGNVWVPGGRWEELQKENPERVKEYIKHNVPLKRFAKPEEIADAVLFMASPKMSFSTGSILRVDGGQVPHI